MVFKLKKVKWNNFAFLVLILFLIVPTTRKSIQIFLNKTKVALISPSINSETKQLLIEPFYYNLYSISEKQVEMPIGQGRITFLNYWATWCPPCIAEMSSIEALYRDYQDQVDFVLISNEDSKTVKDFMKKKGYSLPSYNPLMKTPEILFERSIPTSYLIDQHGKIVIKQKGAVDWNSKKMRDLVDSLLSSE